MINFYIAQHSTFDDFQINGVVLFKMSHLNASVLIKGIPGPILEFILLRKEHNDVAVKTVLSFPTQFDMLEQLHSCYKNVRTVTIQKVGLTSTGESTNGVSCFFCFALLQPKGGHKPGHHDHRGQAFRCGSRHLHLRHSRWLECRTGKERRCSIAELSLTRSIHRLNSKSAK